MKNKKFKDNLVESAYQIMVEDHMKGKTVIVNGKRGIVGKEVGHDGDTENDEIYKVKFEDGTVKNIPARDMEIQGDNKKVGENEAEELVTEVWGAVANVALKPFAGQAAKVAGTQAMKTATTTAAARAGGAVAARQGYKVLGTSMAGRVSTQAAARAAGTSASQLGRIGATKGTAAFASNVGTKTFAQKAAEMAARARAGASRAWNSPIPTRAGIAQGARTGARRVARNIIPTRANRGGILGSMVRNPGKTALAAGGVQYMNTKRDSNWQTKVYAGHSNIPSSNGSQATQTPAGKPQFDPHNGRNK